MSEYTVEQQRNILLDALVSMVIQYCARDGDTLTHSFLSAQEDAFYALVECGEAEWVDNNDYAVRLRGDDE